MATTSSAVINTTDTGSGTPTVPDASVTTKWQEYVWIRHLEAGNANKAKIYVWNPNASSDATYLKWQEISGSVAFSELTGTATEAQLPTISYGKLNLSGAVVNGDLAGSIGADKLAGSISYSKIASVNASTVTSVSNSKIPVAAIPTMSNSDIDTVLAAASVDYAKLNVSAGDIPATALGNGITSAQITSLDAAKITTGTMSDDRLTYMFERNIPIDTIANASGTYNLHTALGSKPFEGIIRVVAQQSSNEVIIALPHPSLSAYVQKAAKLSIYRASSTGKVTIKVCGSGTNSSSFATDKIVDNNNGEITDKVVVLPQLTTAKARKVVIDLVCESKATGSDNGDGQWVVTGGAASTGLGTGSQAGLGIGLGTTTAPPDDGLQAKRIGIGNAAPDDGSGKKISTGTNAGDIPVATTARLIGTPYFTDYGSSYTRGQIITANDNDWSTEFELVVNDVFSGTITFPFGSRTNGANGTPAVRLVGGSYKTGVYGGTNYKATASGGAVRVEVTTKLAASNSETGSTPNPHAKVAFYLEGIQPLGTDGNPLSAGSAWYDPWQGRENIAP